MMRSLETPHGTLDPPAFFPDATRGVVRSLDAEDLEACGIQGVMVNVFHLLTNPGARRVSDLGGIHRFMGWPGPVAADSGGFQVFSLLETSPGLGSVSPKGFTWRHEKGGKKILLTPEKCVRAQLRLRADILFCLDYCTRPEDPPEKQRESVDLTLRWAKKCRETFDRALEEKKYPRGKRPLLFAVVQGGEDGNLRRECAEKLLEIGFDGYGYGGWPISAEGSLSDSVAMVSELTPPDLPRFALGIGKPENIVKAFRAGYQLFDCVIPTRDARHLRLYVFKERPSQSSLTSADFYQCLYLQDKKYMNDKKPLEEDCDCLCCRRYSRAYLYHLFKIGDGLAGRLATIHNLRFYRRLMKALASIAEKR